LEVELNSEKADSPDNNLRKAAAESTRLMRKLGVDSSEEANIRNFAYDFTVKKLGSKPSFASLRDMFLNDETKYDADSRNSPTFEAGIIMQIMMSQINFANSEEDSALLTQAHDAVLKSFLSNLKMPFMERIVRINDEIKFFNYEELSEMQNGIGEFFFKRFSEPILMSTKSIQVRNYGKLLSQLAACTNANINAGDLMDEMNDLYENGDRESIEYFKTPIDQISEEVNIIADELDISISGNENVFDFFTDNKNSLMHHSPKIKKRLQNIVQLLANCRYKDLVQEDVFQLSEQLAGDDGILGSADLDEHTLEARNRLRKGKKQNRDFGAKITQNVYFIERKRK
jgi:hypothetical protein